MVSNPQEHRSGLTVRQKRLAEAAFAKLSPEQELQGVLDKAGPELEDIARTLWRMGVEAAEKRVKSELLCEQPRNLTELIAALDRICPERKGS